ncbi:MAG TPA: hypothetical protein VF304_18885 [Casimicrobiaceae bacterium]
MYRTGQRIAASAHAAYHLGRLWIVAQCIAQQLDALADRVGLHDESRPHLRHQLVVRDDVRCGAYQCEQQVERQLRQRDLGAVALEPKAAGIDAEVVAESVALPGRRLGLASGYG